MGLKTGSQSAMRAMSRMLKMLFGAVLIVVLGYVFIKNYRYIFSIKVDGILQQAKRVPLDISLMQMQGTNVNEAVNPQLFSFAVAIRQDDGNIMTASAEDRQWAAATPGNCVTATYYPYPPWDFSKSGTYHGARLDKQYECPDRLQKIGGKEAVDKLNEHVPNVENLPPTVPEPAATPNL